MSIYKQYLGGDFDKLHPMMQQRFGLTADGGKYMIGRGYMDRIWNAGWHTLPFLLFGTRRNIMFPETGASIPFTIENYAYIDSFGRETVTWIRQFHFKDKIRHFDATMVYSPERKKIVDYLGTMQHLAVDIDMKVNADGSITIQSGNQRFYEGMVGFKFPAFFSGDATVNESYDEQKNRFNISVAVGNKTFGKIFGYNGYFEAEYCDIPATGIPAYAKPLREEIRE